MEVANTNDKPVQIELTLLGDGTIIDVSRLALGPARAPASLLSGSSGREPDSGSQDPVGRRSPRRSPQPTITPMR